MKRRPKTRYGLLDDFGEVIRWVWTKPVGRQFVTQRLPSDYELAQAVGDAPW